jgi:hypothetical protein
MTRLMLYLATISDDHNPPTPTPTPTPSTPTTKSGKILLHFLHIDPIKSALARISSGNTFRIDHKALTANAQTVELTSAILSKDRFKSSLSRGIVTSSSTSSSVSTISIRNNSSSSSTNIAEEGISTQSQPLSQSQSQSQYTCVKVLDTIGGAWPTTQRGHWFPNPGDITSFRNKLRQGKICDSAAITIR